MLITFSIPTTSKMNSFSSYLLPPYTHDSAKDADEMQALFECPQTPLPTEPTYTNLTPSHSESALPTVLTGTPTNPINLMSMFYALKGVTEVWDHFLQKNAQGRDIFMLLTTTLFAPSAPTSCCIPLSWVPGLSPGLELLERITLQGCAGWLQGPHYILRTFQFTPTLKLWNSTFIIASLNCLSFTKVAIPSTTPILMSSLMKPFPALKTLSAPSLPFQTITLLKQVGIYPTHLIR